MEAAKFTLEGDRPSISGEQSAQHMLRDVYSGVTTLLALCAGLTCRLTLRVLVDVWSYFVLAGLTISVPTVYGSQPFSALPKCGDHTR